MGHQALLGFGLTGGAVNEPYEFRSEGIVKQESHVETGGIRGTRSHISENVSEGTYTVGGPLVLIPTPADLVTLLPKILGAAASGTTFALAETLPDFVAQIDRKTKVFAYSGCKVNKASFKSSKGNPLTLDLDIQGKKEGSYSGSTFTDITLGSAGTFPSLTLSVLQPYMHHQLVLTIGGTAYEVDDIDITIDNALILDRFNNSQSRTELPEGDRIITVSATFPYSTSETALYNIATAGAAATAVYTNGNYSITFTFAVLQAAAKSPVVQSRNGEIVLPIDFVARMSGSTRELVILNDSTG